MNPELLSRPVKIDVAHEVTARVAGSPRLEVIHTISPESADLLAIAIAAACFAAACFVYGRGRK